MASTSSKSFSAPSHAHEKPNTASIWAVVASINQQILEFISDTETWESVKLKCTSTLKIQSTECLEFSEHSVLSNLYWGIENIEAAIGSELKEEKLKRLEEVEKMLQAPALLDEKGKTADVANEYLVCCSYFYLSVAKKIQGDVLKAATHFLQAVLVSSRLVWTEFAPEICRNLFLLHRSLENEEIVSGRKEAELERDFSEREICEEMGHVARKYKGWLTYYQVMSYGETKRHSGHRDIVSPDIEMHSSQNWKSISSTSQQYGNSSRNSFHSEKVHPLGYDEFKTEGIKSNASSRKQIQEEKEIITPLVQFHGDEKSKNFARLQELLKESQSDTPFSDECSDIYSSDENEHEVHVDDSKVRKRNAICTDNPQPETSDHLRSVWKQATPYSTSDPEYVIFQPQVPGYLAYNDRDQANILNSYSSKFNRSFSANEPLELDLRKMVFYDDYCKEYQLTKPEYEGSFRSSSQKSYFNNDTKEIFHLGTWKNSEIGLMGIIDKVISKLCLGSCDEKYTVEVVRMYEMLSNKKGIKYTLLKDIILDQLLKAISSSKEVGVIRVSISILSVIVYENKTVVNDLNKNGLELYDLASALKRNVQEAAILIHLINPSPLEIKTLELLPILMEIVCYSKSYNSPLPVLKMTPPVASLRIIEVLVTAFDDATNNMHLAEINTPKVFPGLLGATRENNSEDFTSLAAILVRCMQFDGLCRKDILKSAPMRPFISLLGCNQQRTELIILEFFHEMLRMPRCTSLNLMQQIHKEESANNMDVLLLLIQELQQGHKLFAANLLLQLDVLEDSPGKSIYREEAAKVILKSLACEENSSVQVLAAFVIANMGGTYSWGGEPYTVAWLLKKTGLISQHHRNMIRNVYWSDESLHDPSTDKWSSKIAKSIIKIGKPLFRALGKGLKSNIKEVSRDCLIASAWISYEIARAPNNLRYAASEFLLSAIEPFLHPGCELEERILACLCIYNYASGQGMHRITHFSEGVMESLRRLTSITWIAQELLRVAEYYQPNKWRISCVHTQILEAGQKYSGAVTALIYYRGQLCSGYADGSIKVWNIEGQTATLAFEVKEHKKAVTCFSLFEPMDGLLSGSADKTIRIWRMVQNKLEGVEIIPMKEQVRSLDTQGQMIFAVTKSNQLKALDQSRIVKDICKARKVKCMKLANGKVYAGCTDSSIQELNIAHNQERDIKGPSKNWMMQSKPVNSIAVHRDWLYSASAAIEGSSIKEWRRGSKPQVSFVPEKGTNILAMEVVEDFIYLNSSSSTSTLQIWLRGTQQKVGRLSAGSKITSLLCGNDTILCGTEAGLIKGWIPL